MGKLKWVIIFIVTVFVMPFFCDAQKAGLPQNNHRVIVIAHRGDHTEAPENTLASYQNAINDGADFVEIDLRETKDSQLVIMHNDNINNMTGYDGDVQDMLFGLLRTKKVRDKNNLEWGLHQIPTFKEVLQLCKGKINIYLDFKKADVALAFKEIFDAGMQEHVVVYINEPHQFNEWATVAPMMPLMISLPSIVKTRTEMLTLLGTYNIDILDGDYTEYNAETVAAATEKHIPIWADVQAATEAEDKWKAALALGLAGLQTNHPKQLIRYLIEKGIR